MTSLRDLFRLALVNVCVGYRDGTMSSEITPDHNPMLLANPGCRVCEHSVRPDLLEILNPSLLTAPLHKIPEPSSSPRENPSLLSVTNDFSDFLPQLRVNIHMTLLTLLLTPKPYPGLSQLLN